MGGLDSAAGTGCGIAKQGGEIVGCLLASGLGVCVELIGPVGDIRIDLFPAPSGLFAVAGLFDGGVWGLGWIVGVVSGEDGAKSRPGRAGEGPRGDEQLLLALFDSFGEDVEFQLIVFTELLVDD